MLQYCLQHVCSQQSCHVFGIDFGDVKISQVGKSCIILCATLCGGRSNCGIVQASIVIWTAVSWPSKALTWNDTLLEHTGPPDELVVPSRKGLFLPTRPIVSENFSKISRVWLPESSSANIFTFTPLEVATTMGMICSRTVKGRRSQTKLQ